MNKLAGTAKDETGVVSDVDDWSDSSNRNVYIVVGLIVVAIALALFLTLGDRQPTVTEDDSARLGRATAQFTDLDGAVTVKANGTMRWVSGVVEQKLNENDLVRTGSRSTAAITFIDETVVNVSPDSLVAIENVAEDPTTRQRRVAWTVSSGGVDFERRAASGVTSVSTPTLRTELSDLAQASIRVEEQGNSSIRLFRGRGQVETKEGQRVELAANQALLVDSEGNAGDTLELPPAPRLVAPADASTTGERARLSWAAVTNAVDYRVVVAEDERFARVVADAFSAGRVESTVGPLENGEYYWHVSAIGLGGGEGVFSAPQRFVASRASAPGLTIEILEASRGIVRIAGRTDPGTRLTIGGQRIPVGEDGRFEEFLTPPPGMNTLVLVAVGRNGATTEVSRQIGN